MKQPRWLTLLFVMMALVALFFVCHCGGSNDGDYFTPSFPISPVADGGLSEDSLAGSDGARGPGLDATFSGEFRGEADATMVSEGTDVGDTAPPLDSHISDPWPVDVVVERVPAPNCFVDPQGQTACCFPRGQPPVDCMLQNQPHYCEVCPK